MKIQRKMKKSINFLWIRIFRLQVGSGALCFKLLQAMTWPLKGRLLVLLSALNRELLILQAVLKWCWPALSSVGWFLLSLNQLLPSQSFQAMLLLCLKLGDIQASEISFYLTLFSVFPYRVCPLWVLFLKLTMPSVFSDLSYSPLD